MQLNQYQFNITFVSQLSCAGSSEQVWDVLSNKEVVGIVASAPRSSAAKVLVESAVQAWRTKLPTSKVDDCSVVCLFFDTHANLNSANNINNLIPEASINHSDTVVQKSPPYREGGDKEITVVT